MFREILALNPKLSAFAPIAPALDRAAAGDEEAALTEILVPLKFELANRVSPALTSVRAGVESALKITESAIARVEKYAAIAESAGLTELSSEVNGVLGPVKNVLGEGQKAVAEYGNGAGAVKLVDWLLG